MRIYVFRVQKLYLYLIAFIVIAFLIAAAVRLLNSGVASVFRSERELPIYSVDCKDKKVAITFDCAWGAEDIPYILSTLDKEKVKATFFIVGQWAEKFPDAIKAMAQGGHDVANHSYSHLRMSSLDSSKIKSEITKCTEKLYEMSKIKTNLFRPPYGDYNNKVVRTAKELGYYTIQWDVDSLDWKPGISQDEILARVMKKVKPGSIILFHNDTPHTARLLPAIIKLLKDEGYSIVPVSSLIMHNNYYIDFDGRQKRYLQ